MKLQLRIQKSLFVSIVLAGLGACGQKEKVVKVSENTFGLDFKYTPISQESPGLQSLSKAIAHVQYAEGSGATGFFISSDGLFLTNEHVLSRDRCGTRCAGVRIIRDFAPNGDFEVFNHLTVIAHNASLDFSLVKVELEPGKSVPFVQLDFLDTDAFKVLRDSETELKIVGHPFLASLQSAKGYILRKTGPMLRLKSVAISGNSGSPLINPNTLKAIALYHASSWNKNSIEIGTGAVKHYGEALALTDIREALSRVWPELAGKDRWSVKDFDEPLTEDQKEEFADLLPHESKGEIKTYETLVAQNLSTPSESEALARYIKHIARSSTADADMGWELDELVKADLARGQKISLTDEQYAILSKKIDKGHRRSLEVHLGKLDQAECMKNISVGWDGLTESGEDCLSQHIQAGDDVVTAFEYWASIETPGTSDIDWVNSLAESVFTRQLRLGRVLSESERRAALDILEKVAGRATNASTAYSAEGLYTLIQHDPSLLAPGKSQSLFPPVEDAPAASSNGDDFGDGEGI